MYALAHCAKLCAGYIQHMRSVLLKFDTSLDIGLSWGLVAVA